MMQQFLYGSLCAVLLGQSDGLSVPALLSPPPKCRELSDHSKQSTRNVSYVNSKRVRLNYKVEEQGPSGIAAVELWTTRDGAVWAKLDEKPGNPEPPYVVTVADEGLYGFTLLGRTGAGLKDREPRAGDAPMIWVEVDTKKPTIDWLNVDVGRGADAGKLFITWKATDENFGRAPVKLSYGENANGPWRVVGSDLSNTGRFEWTMPPDVPVEFFVQLEVADKVGNAAIQTTPKPINVDLKIPRLRILSAIAASSEPPLALDQGGLRLNGNR
jgi:hypothetical protein